MTSTLTIAVAFGSGLLTGAVTCFLLMLVLAHLADSGSEDRS